VKRPLVGHADLTHIFSTLADAPRGLIAGLFGWEERPPELNAIPGPLQEHKAGPQEALTPVTPESSGPWPGSAVPCPFWRVARFIPRDVTPTSQIVVDSPGEPNWRAQ
jgi:hypothetical protein